ncbi:MAG: transaldolase family protein, partial [Pseudomonadota bacterium]
MKFFIDSAEINEIKELNTYGLVDGVTTNPTLISKSGKDFFKV